MSKRKPKEADKKVSPPEMDKQTVDAEENQEAEIADTPGSDMSNGDHGEEPEIKVRELQEHNQDLAEENSCLKDQLLRKAADFENFRKRMLREKEDGIRYANSALLMDIVPIIDDFERAIQAAAETADFPSFHQGVAMIEKQLVSILERNWSLKRFISLGEEFDPEKHQAIAIEETDKYEAAIILEDYQKGYYLQDRVLRPSKVKVAKPISPGESSDKSESEIKRSE
jgi:molecular chaperone GrpE